jgi:hypothetical protein
MYPTSPSNPSTQDVQLLQIIQVRALLLGGFGGQGLVVALDVVQVQTMQLRVQSRQVTRGNSLYMAVLSKTA